MLRDRHFYISYVYLRLLNIVPIEVIRCFCIEWIVYCPVELELLWCVRDGPLIVVLIEVAGAMAVIEF